MIPLVSYQINTLAYSHILYIDYEQQRLDLLHKHGIDIGDSNGIADGRKTKRMKRQDIEKIMGEGEGGIFTWREKNRKKVSYIHAVLTSTLLIY